MADIETISEQEQQIFKILKLLQKMMTESQLNAKQTRQIMEFVSDVFSHIEWFITPENKLESVQLYEILFNIDKNFDFSRVYQDNRMRIILHYNIAYCYQDREHMHITKTLTHIESCLYEYWNYIKIKEEQGLNDEFDNLKLNRFLVQVCLQTAAMYGNECQSERAINLAVEAFDYTSVILQNLKNFYSSFDVEKNQRHCQLLTFFNDFERYYNEVNTVKMNPTKAAMRPNKPLNWEYNYQNNEKYFTQSNSEYGDKLKFYADFLKELNIGNMMILEPINEDLFEEYNYEDIFGSDDFLINFVLLFSLSLYTISTEKRIISTISEEERLKAHQSNRIYQISLHSHEYRAAREFNSALSAKRSISLSQNLIFMESEFFMKKCLEALNRYLEESMLFKMVLSQYYKHFTKVVNYITEEEEPSQTYSALFTDRKEKRSVINDNEDISTSNIIINNINITHNMCNIDNGKSFKKKRPDTKLQSTDKVKLDLTPIKTSINDLCGPDNNIAKDLDHILNELKTSPTLEPRTSRESANNYMLDMALTITEKDEKVKSKILLPKKGYLTKNAKALKELIESQKDDIVVKRLKSIFTHNKQPTIDDIKKALITKEESKRPVSNSKLAKHKSQDIQIKVKDIIKNNIFSNKTKKGSFALPHKNSKNEMVALNFNKCKEVFSKHHKTVATKVASPRLQLDFNKRKNSPVQVDRPDTCFSILKQYRTVDLSSRREVIPDSSRNLVSPRDQGPTLDIKTIKANLKNSTMKSSRSRDRKNFNLHALKSLEDYKSFNFDDGSLSSRRDINNRPQSPLIRHPRVMSSSKLSPRLNKK